MPKLSDLPEWIEKLESEDLNFIRRFVLASGSLKELADQYSVSYPTIRARLDALIDKIQAASMKGPDSALKHLVRELVREGEIELGMARKLIAASKKDVDAALRTEKRSEDL